MTTEEKRKKLYHCWFDLRNRCYNKRNKAYPNYGARGIKIEEPSWWVFENFLAWAWERYQPGLTLDRIDNTKGYSANNCRFATYKIQAINSIKPTLVDHGGIVDSVCGWCERLCLNHSTVVARLRCGWTVKQALGVEPRPKRQRNRHIREALNLA